MKRYEAYIGLFTKGDGSLVKVEDVEKVIDSLAAAAESRLDVLNKVSYRLALEEIRQQVRNST